MATQPVPGTITTKWLAAIGTAHDLVVAVTFVLGVMTIISFLALIATLVGRGRYEPEIGVRGQWAGFGGGRGGWRLSPTLALFGLTAVLATLFALAPFSLVWLKHETPPPAPAAQAQALCAPQSVLTGATKANSPNPVPPQPGRP